MTMPVLPNPAQMMPAYIESVRSFIEREFTSELTRNEAAVQAHVVATERSGYVEIRVFLGVAIMQVGAQAGRFPKDELGEAEARRDSLLPKAKELAQELEQKLEEQGHSIIIYVRAG